MVQLFTQGGYITSRDSFFQLDLLEKLQPVLLKDRVYLMTDISRQDFPTAQTFGVTSTVVFEKIGGVIQRDIPRRKITTVAYCSVLLL